MSIFPERRLWICLLFLYAVDLIWITATDFQVALAGWPLALGGCAVLFTVGWVYATLRPAPEITHMCFATAFMILATGAIAMLSYLMTSLNVPLLDNVYADIDRFFGFDWLALLEWTNDRPILGMTLIISYHSSMLQIACIVVLLALTGRPERVNEFMGLFMITGTVVIVSAGFFPAAGAYVYYNPAPELFANLNPQAGLWHLEQFTALRDGTQRLINLSAAEGLVTFPSFHTCLAVIVTWAVRDFRIILCAFAALNALVIVSTLPEGGHHLIDVIAGALIATVTIAVWSRVSSYTPAGHAEQLATSVEEEVAALRPPASAG